MITSLVLLLAKVIELLKLMIFIKIALTWFPNIQWWKQPFKLLDEITEPVLAPFRRFIPPIGGMDLSPLVCFLFLGFMKSVLYMIPHII
ncbi:MAG: YggT family protein [bacterium]